MRVAMQPRMKKITFARALPLCSLLLMAFSAGACGGVGGIDPNVDTVNATENVDGDSNSSTTVDDVAVEEANVDADADVDVDVDVGADVADSGNIDVDVNIEREPQSERGGASTSGEGVVLEATYQGPIDERVDLVPGFDDALVSLIDSVEWIARGPVFGPATIFDDEDGFAWGAPQFDDVDDTLDEYTLAVRMSDEALDAFAWTTESAWCTDGVCDGRAVSAACSATIVLRVWFTDGTSRDVAVDHESARPTCA